MLIIPSISCTSVSDRRKEVISTILEMGKHKTQLPIDKMICWDFFSSGNYIDSIEKAKLKVVVYADTSNCSSCYLSKMKLWNDFLKLENDYNGKIRFVFIIESRKNESKALYDQLELTGLEHPIFIDDKGVFMKSNPHIPLETLYHTFVLDDKNNIVLVGNPLISEEIEKILYELIDSKFSKT